MAQYIEKSALVAEIERRIKEHHSGYLVCLKDILSFINTLEVKEVDLNNITPLPKAMKIVEITAKHFFELGLKAQKIQDEIKIGETEIYLEDDGGEPPYDGIQWLDLSCMEYEIPKDKFKDGDNVEIIIRKK